MGRAKNTMCTALHPQILAHPVPFFFLCSYHFSKPDTEGCTEPLVAPIVELLWQMYCFGRIRVRSSINCVQHPPIPHHHPTPTTEVPLMLVLHLLLFLVSATTALPTKSVLIFRHCLRSTPTSAYGAPGYNDFNNYSSHQFPKWPVPVYQCLPHGLTLVQAAGKQIGPSLPSPVVFKVDTSAQRDIDTANSLLVGMGKQLNSFVSAPALFDPPCPHVEKTKAIAALKARFAASTPPKGHTDRLQRLQTLLGQGVAPAIDTIKDTVKDNGYFTGGSSIASEFAEAFLMQYGGSMPQTAWGEITSATQIYDYIETHIYYRGINDRVLPLVSRSHSMMTDAITNFLSNSSVTGTLVLVGHDADLDALAELFGMSWHTTPFPKNATTPGSALRFDLDTNNNVAASVQYQDYNGSSDVLTVPATFNWWKTSNEVLPTLEDINGWLKPRLDQTCR